MTLHPPSDRSMSAGQAAAPENDAVLVTINQIAKILGCSTRHVRRLAAGGRIPRPIKLGALLRWLKADVEQWISAGCPNCRKGGRR